jgi:hypothetical protein
MNWLRDAPLLAITIVLVAIMGLGLLAGGAWLAALGGSVYYLIAGIMLLLTSWLLARRRAEALWIYAALLAATMAWAIWEAGLDFAARRRPNSATCSWAPNATRRRCSRGATAKALRSTARGRAASGPGSNLWATSLCSDRRGRIAAHRWSR